MVTRTAYDPTPGEVLTAANLEKLPGGWIGYAEVTADQGSIAGTGVDLTGLSVTVTVNASRRIRITGSTMPRSSVANDVARLYIQGSGNLQFQDVVLSSASVQEGLIAVVVLTPSAGSHTYKLVMQRAVGTGTIISGASTTNPAFILVEDIGPAS